MTVKRHHGCRRRVFCGPPVMRRRKRRRSGVELLMSRPRLPGVLTKPLPISSQFQRKYNAALVWGSGRSGKIISETILSPVFLLYLRSREVPKSIKCIQIPWCISHETCAQKSVHPSIHSRRYRAIQYTKNSTLECQGRRISWSARMLNTRTAANMKSMPQIEARSDDKSRSSEY